MQKSLGLTMILLLGSISTAHSAEPQTAGRFTDLGVQITSSTIIGTTFGKDAQGHPTVYTVMRGQPAKLLAFDLQTGAFEQSLPLPGADGAWNACTSTDGSIYVGTDANGHLYRYIPGEKSVHDLGTTLPKETWIWSVTPGKNGEIFGGTYPGGKVFRYHPRDGFKDISHGSVVTGEQYCRSVAYDEETGKVYAGIGSHAHLVEIDPKTGAKTEMLPAEYHDQEFVYGVRVFHGHLFALLTRADKSLVFDLHTHKMIGVIPKIAGQQVMTADDRGNVYYTIDNQLTRFSYTSPTQPPVKIARTGDALGYTWQGNSILEFTRYGAIVTCDPVTGKTSNITCKLPAEPTDIQSIALGPDGKIWTGGYLSGGNATFDPATGKSEGFKGLSQAEGISSAGSVLYFGLYPGAKLAEYDTAKPWSTKDNNPHQFGDLGPENQSRPIAMLGVQSLNKVFIGTVPEYGQLGGVLAIYDIATKKLDVHHDVIATQSICSLAFDKNLIIGGSTIWGGLGQKPTESEAKLFIWDPATNQKTAELSPVRSAKAITGLFVGPDGNIWAMADGTLFLFDPASQKVLETHPLFPIHFAEDSHVWRDANFVLLPNGQIYGAVHDQFFQLDPATKKVTPLRDKAGDLIAADRDGKIYFHEGTHLWQYAPHPE